MPRHGRSGPWFTWFGILACAITILAGSRYLVLYNFPGSFSGYLYPALAVVGHLSLVVLGSLTFVWLLFRMLPPLRRASGPAVVVTAALILTLVIVDTIAFAEHQFHLNVFTAALFEPATWVVAGVMLVAIFQVHFAQGFKMIVANGRVGGYEWQVALLCMAVCLIMRGAGPLSLDRLVTERMAAR